MRKGVIVAICIALGTMLPMVAFAANGDLELLAGSARFVPENPTQGKSTRIYATIKNNSKDDLYGTVKFFNKTKNTNIGGDQPVSVIAGKTDDVFVNWDPYAGKQTIEVTIIPWQKGDNTANNSYIISVNVVGDFDFDGIPDGIDPDKDGDGTPNTQDTLPLDPKEWKDTDGDGTGDNSDTDIDGDGLTNDQEKNIGTDPINPDTDGDKVSDDKDAFPLDPKEWKDTDGDGTGDNSDTDIDGDGLTNDQEKNIGTDPINPDTDGDKVSDDKDAFPLDPKEWKDTNHNGTGDNSDPDKDGDGIPNIKDPFPSNITPVATLQNNQINPLIVSIGEPFKLNAGPSYDPDGKITEISWTIDGKKKYEGVSPAITIDEPGNHVIELSVKDNSGEVTKKSWTAFGAASIFTSQGGIATVLIALALLAVLYYSTKAFRKDSSKGEQSQKH